MENQQQAFSASGIPIKDIYTPEDVKDMDYDRDLGLPGNPPFTRGVHSTMYRGQLWTIRRLTGFNTPEDTNALYKQEYELGQRGFSVAPDISAAAGMDPDDPRITADIGHAGVPIFSVEDMKILFAGLPLEVVAPFLADRLGGLLTPAYFTMARRRGVDLKQLRGTTANDLSSWMSVKCGNYIPPRAILRFAIDLIEWCSEHAPRWNPVSFNSYNARENGINAVQEIGMLLATAIQYIEEEKRRGRVPLDRFVRRFTFNTAVHNDFFEEIAKLRAARRMWYKIIRERYGIEDPSCALFRNHVQSSGSTHTYQEPLNNLIRIAYQVMAGALGGAQSIHANGYDEAICLPTHQSMLLSIRTEQILALETNVANTIDPLGGSWYVESLTNELEERILEYIQTIEDMGGIVEAIDSGWIHKEFKTAFIEHERKLSSGELPIVGVSKFRLKEEPYKVPIFRPNPQSANILIERINRIREERDDGKVTEALKMLERVLRGDGNTFHAIMEAVEAHATPGELANVGIKVYGLWNYPMGI